MVIAALFTNGFSGARENTSNDISTQTALALAENPTIQQTGSSTEPPLWPSVTIAELSPSRDTPIPETEILTSPTDTDYPTETAGPTALLSQIVDLSGVEMALVPAGDFAMGREDGNSNEGPIHTVYLDDYYIDVYPATNASYAKCRDSLRCPALTCLNSVIDNPDYADHPVACVGWNMAYQYCEWRRANLPTEAQWEKAARGGLQAALYPWGDEDPVCTPGATNGAQFGNCSGKTAPVGSFSPNGYGLYDMVGNIWEWVYDWYAPDYYARSRLENPFGPTSGEFRVLRGGSWYTDTNLLRVSYRRPENPGLSLYYGVRCARSAE